MNFKATVTVLQIVRIIFCNFFKKYCCGTVITNLYCSVDIRWVPIKFISYSQLKPTKQTNFSAITKNVGMKLCY